jgi:hypothetical protein
MIKVGFKMNQTTEYVPLLQVNSLYLNLIAPILHCTLLSLMLMKRSSTLCLALIGIQLLCWLSFTTLNAQITRQAPSIPIIIPTEANPDLQIAPANASKAEKIQELQQYLQNQQAKDHTSFLGSANQNIAPKPYDKNKVYGYVHNSPVAFYPNIGQVRDQDGNACPNILYTGAHKGVSLYFSSKGLSYVFSKCNQSLDAPTSLNEPSTQYGANVDAQGRLVADPISFEAYRMDMELVNANPTPQILAQKEAIDYLNFYLAGRVPEATNVKGYQLLIYKEVYPNIDLYFYGRNGEFKYDFIVHPGGHVSDIQIKYVGANSLKLDEQGNLSIETPMGTITEKAPFSYQEIPARYSAEEVSRIAGSSNVATQYVVNGNILTFSVPNHDNSRVLVIDPTLDWYTFYGTGTVAGNERTFGADVDLAGDVVYCGFTSNATFPTTAGVFQPAVRGTIDAFVAKFSRVGTRLWATYVGGNTSGLAGGLEFDSGGDVAVDQVDGAIYLAGSTSNSDFPVTAGAAQTVFGGGNFDSYLFKLSPTGARLWGSYYGGNNEDIQLFWTGTTFNWFFGSTDVAVDRNRKPVIVGSTSSANIPGRVAGVSFQFNHASPGFVGGATQNTDVFVARFSDTGNRIEYATYIGGQFADFSNAIAIDQGNNYYISGGTGSANFPVFNGNDIFHGAGAAANQPPDAFLFKMAPNGNRIWATFFGGGNNFEVWDNVPQNDVTIDADNNPVISGIITTPALATFLPPAQLALVTGTIDPTTPGTFDSYVMKFASAGGANSLLWGQVWGGSATDFTTGIQPYTDNRLAVSGYTLSTNFPTTGTPLQAATGGGNDGTLTILNPKAAAPPFITYATYMGSTGVEQIHDVVVSQFQETYLGGFTTLNVNFLPAPRATFAAVPSAGGDALFMKFTDPLPTPDCGITGGRIEVLALTHGTDLANEYVNTIDALKRFLSNFNLTETPTTTAAVVSTLLAGKDVVIIPEIEDPGVDLTFFTAIGPALNAFVSAGGTVIFLGSNRAGGASPVAFDNAIWNTGLLTGGNTSGINVFPFDAQQTPEARTSCLVDGLPATMTFSPTVVPYDITTVGARRIFDVIGLDIVTERNLGLGKVVLIGADYDAYDDNLARLLGNAVSCRQNSSRIQVKAVVTPDSCLAGNVPGTAGAITVMVNNAPSPVSISWDDDATVNTFTRRGLAPGDYEATITAGPSGACTEVLQINVPRCGLSDSLADFCRPLRFDVRPSVTQMCEPATPVNFTLPDSNAIGDCGSQYDLTPIPFAPLPVGAGAVLVSDFGNMGVTDDLIDGPYPMGFDFNFFCNRYRNFYISENGFITFDKAIDPGGILNNPQTLPNRLPINNLIALQWANLSAQSAVALGGSVTYFTDGTAPNRRTVITYNQVPFFDLLTWFNGAPDQNTKPTFSGQIILFENGVIELHLANSPQLANENVNLPGVGVVPVSYFKTVGIENADGTQVVFVPGRNRANDWSATSVAFRFTPSVRWSNLRIEWYQKVGAGPKTLIPGATNRTLTSTPPETTVYTARIYHGRHCYSESDTTIFVDKLSIGGRIQSSQTVCPNINSGTLNLTGNRGQVVQWEQASPTFGTGTTIPGSAGRTSQTFNNLTVNTQYRVLVRNGVCAPRFSDTITVTLDRPRIAYALVKPVSCNGGSDGEIVVSVTGGRPFADGSYRYAWFKDLVLQPGLTTPRVTGLRAGRYTVAVTDSNGCETRSDTLVREPALPVRVVLANKLDITCFGVTDGAIDITPTGGSGPGTYTFAWDDNPAAVTEDRSGLGRRCYSVTVTDVNGCKDSLLNICIIEPPIIQVDTVLRRPTCNGFSDGQITITVRGGNPDYRYTWGDLTGPPGLITDRRSLCAGIYTLTVTDRNGTGCSRTLNFNLGEPAPISFTLQRIKPVSCTDGADGEVQLDVRGGTQNYTFVWNDTRPTRNEDLIGVRAGEYCITVTDANRCVASQCFTVPAAAPFGARITAVTTPSCNGSANGSIAFEATGGVEPYRFFLGGSPIVSPITALVAREYCIDAVDANQCTTSVCTTLTQPAPVQIVTEQIKHINCANGTDGLINIDVSGGTGAGYSFAWTGPGVVVTNEDQQQLVAGSYCVTATDINRCTASRCYVLTQPTPLVITRTLTVNPRCSGEANGQAQVTVSGGILPFTFQWTRGIEVVSRTLALTNVGSGVYTFRVTDANGCTASVTVDLTAPAPIAFTNPSITPVRCFNECTGSIRWNVAGGTAPYIYGWSNSRTTEDITALCAGNYCLTVTDSRGCRATQCTTLTQPTRLVIDTLIANPPTCAGATDGIIEIDALGGTSPYVYAWSAGVTNAGRIGLNINGLLSPYSVTVTDGNGCTRQATFNLPAPDSVRITGVVSPALCNAASSGSITITPTGGFLLPGGDYVYNWTRNTLPFATTRNLVNINAGRYCVTVVDNNTCRNNACFDITEPTALVTSFTKRDVSCFGIKDGTATVTVSGGIAPYTFEWLDSDNPGWDRATLPNTGAGDKIVIVRDANRCEAIVTIRINEPPQLIATVQDRIPVQCFGETNGEIRLNVSGGTGSYTYNWLPSTGTMFGTNYTGLTSGIYAGTITDANNCRVLLNNIVVSGPTQALSILLSSVSNPRCFGSTNGSITVTPVGGTPGYTYLWNRGITSTTTTATNLSALEYCVTVTDASGCTAIRCQTLTQPDRLTINSTSVRPPSCNGGVNGAIDVNVTGGTPFPAPSTYQYLWTTTDGRFTNAVNIEDQSGLTAGTYTLTARDARNCVAQSVFTLTTPAAIQVIVDQIIPESCSGNSDGAIRLTVNGGTGTLTYAWTPPVSTSNNAIGLAAGIYSVVISDGNGCSAIETFTVGSNSTLTATLNSKRNPTCSGRNDGEILVDVNGGLSPYTYTWSPPNGNKDLLNVGAGSYSLTVTDFNGCEAFLNVTLEVPNAITFVLESVENPSCFEGTNGKIDFEISGGTLPYRYLWSNNSTNDVAINLAAGPYFLTVTDANDCVATSPTITLTQPNRLELTLNNKQDVRCFGQNNGQIDMQVNGGTGPYQFFLTDGNSPPRSIVSISPIANLVAGTYCVGVNDANGCSFDLCVDITQPDQLVITVDNIASSSCDNSPTGGIEVTVSGGVEPYAFLWNDQLNSTTEDLSNVIPDSYCLTVTDANSCIATRCAEVPLVPSTAAEITRVRGTYCLTNAPELLEGTPTGGTFVGPGIVANRFNPRLAGIGRHLLTYEVQFDGCFYRAETTVNVVNAPSRADIIFSGLPAGPPFCSNNSSVYSLSYTPLQPGISAVFSGPNVRFTGAGYVFTPAGLAAGNYDIQLRLVLGSTGCDTIIRTTVAVDVPNNVFVNASKTSVCPGESTVLTATGGLTYNWASTTGLSCAPNCTGVGATVTANPVVNTTYTVTGIVGGCRASRAITINVRPAPAIAIAANRTTICEGETVRLNATSVGNFNYTWTDGGTPQTGPEISVTPIVTTTYTVTGADINRGCGNVATQTITVNPSGLSATVSPGTSICSGETITLTAAATPPGAATFTWRSSTSATPRTGAVITETPTQTTTYTVTRSGTGQCFSRTLTVTVASNTTTIRLPSTQFCANDCRIISLLTEDGSIGTFSGPGVIRSGTDFAFVPCSTRNVSTVEICFRGSNTSTFCSVDACTTVTIAPRKKVQAVGLRSSYCSISNPVFLDMQPPNATVSGPGIVPASTTFRPDLAPAGANRLILTAPTTIDQNCWVNDTINVNVTTAPSIVSNIPSRICISAGSLTLTATPAGGTFSGRGVVGNTFDPALSGRGAFPVTYSGSVGPCAYSSTVLVSVVDPPTVRATATCASGPFVNDGQIVVTATGTLSPVEYSIDGTLFQASPVFNALLPGAYTISVRDASTCLATTSVTVCDRSAACATPTNVIVSSVGSAGATVTWTAVSGALSYEVNVRVVGSPPSATPISVTTNTASLTGLNPSTNYQVTVRSLCAAGERSLDSSPATFTTTGVPVCPTTSIANVVTSTSTAVVTWVPVTGILSYELSWRLVTSSAFITTTVAPTVNSFVISGLNPGANYEVRIRARCASGFSAMSEPFAFRTQGGSQTTCPAPIILSTTPTANRIRVTWGVVSGAVGYVIQFRVNGSTAPFVSVNLNSPTAVFYDLTSLSPNTAYQIRLQTRCANDLRSNTVERVVTTTARREGDVADLWSDLRLYPNPNKGQFMISLESTADEPSVQFRVLTLNGQLVYRQDAAVEQGINQWSIDIPSISAGVYLLQIQMGAAVQTHKLMVD